MAFSEQRVLKQVSILSDRSSVNVQWADQILRDDEVISEIFHRCAYNREDKDKFLSEVENASLYLEILGWN